MNKNDTFFIKGLEGKRTLNGVIDINGAKNAALKAIAASILFDGPVVLENVPNTEDVKTMFEVLRKLGAKIGTLSHTGQVSIDASNLQSVSIDPALAQSMRASVVLTGPILARYGKVVFPSPGGCVIGSRPIDLFIKGYEKMGAKTDLKECLYYIDSNDKSLNGSEVFFDLQSVGGTETLMMAAVLANGKTILKNCAMEPEIVSIAQWLNSCGANISGAGTTTIEIVGTDGKLLKPKIPYRTIPDRIEAGSFLILGALCAEDLLIDKCEPKHIESVVNLLRESGVDIEVSHTSGDNFGSVRVRNKKDSKSFKAFNVRTHEYPGFPTDLQAQIVTFLTEASGEGVVFETIFEGRFKYVEDLQRMGADISVLNSREVLVRGRPVSGKILKGVDMKAHDIRAGFALVVAALLAKGDSRITNVHLIDRGYEELEIRLNKVGAQIKRFSS